MTETTAPPAQAASPWRNRDFRWLFAGTAASQLGFQIGYVVLPLVAVLALDASTGQVGLLATMSTVAFLLIGLPAGAWVDRMRRRRLMVAADLVRAVLIVSVPLAWALDVLTLAQLYAVALLLGCATVFFDVASMSQLPELVGRQALLGANAQLVSLQAASNVAGRSVAGGLVQAVTAPFALLVHAGSMVVSAWCVARIAAPDLPPERTAEGRESLVAQIRAGLRHVLGGRELRALLLSGGLSNLGLQLANALLPVLFVTELGLSAGALGLFWAAGGVGIFLGARLARPFARWWGLGRTLGVMGLLVAPAGLLVPHLDRGAWLWIAGAGWVLITAKIGVDNVLSVSLRMSLTPAALHGRMNATFRFVLMGMLAVASALAAAIGELWGVRAVLWAAAFALLLVPLPVLCSPVRSIRVLPDATTTP